MTDRMHFTSLGCGSSGGVPRLGGHWGDCDPNNPKNARRRCSLLVERESDAGKTTVLIDTSPDLRNQLLDAGVGRLDAVIYTHSHADHVHGIDDLRDGFLIRLSVDDSQGVGRRAVVRARALGKWYPLFGERLLDTQARGEQSAFFRRFRKRIGSSLIATRARSATRTGRVAAANEVEPGEEPVRLRPGLVREEARHFAHPRPLPRLGARPSQAEISISGISPKSKKGVGVGLVSEP